MPLTPTQKTKCEALRASGALQFAIATELGVSEDMVRRHLKRVGKSGRIAESDLTQVKPDTSERRREIRDATFWRSRSKRLDQQLADAEYLLEQMAGVRHQAITPPAWLLPAPSARKSKSVIGLLLTDIHAGEKVDPDEILGLNAYNVDICRRRLRRYFAAACEIGPRWQSDCSNQGALVVLGGDLVSGDIHEELRITNELTAHEQVRFAVEEIIRGIDHVIEAFGRAHVVSVPGNHGRTTVKPTAKLYSRLSYDTLAATMVADHFKKNSKVTFQIGSSRDAIVPVLGRTVFINHGDGMGTGGGQGFIGPMAPILRGTKKVEAQQARAGRQPHLILHGHYHTSGNPGNVLSNGSVPGYTEYGNGLRAALEPPQQWLFLMHERWGLRERVEVKLEDPGKALLPATQIPTAMAV